MIAVTGASGQLGQLVIEELLKLTAAQNIIAVVRDPAKVKNFSDRGVQVRKGDYNDPQTLNEAFSGVDKILLISSNEVGGRLKQHEAVILAAKKKGVKLFAYTSILNIETTSMKLAAEHIATEKLIKEAELPFVFLRNGWYTENYFGSIVSAVEHGTILGSAKEGRISSAARADYAKAAAVVLTKENQAGKIYELAGDHAFTLNELAQAVSEISGKKVVYQDLPEKDYAEVLIKIGLPEGFARILADADVGIAKGDLFSTRKDLSELIGRQTTPIEVSVKQTLGK